MNADTKIILNAMKEIDANNTIMFKGIDKKFSDMDARFDGIDNRLDGIDVRLDGIEDRLDKVEGDVKIVKLTLENEVHRDIKLLAEGHVGLSRQISELQKDKNKNDHIAIDVLWLKDRMEKVEKKVEHIA